MKDSENKSKEGVIFKADTETFKKKNDVRYIYILNYLERNR